MQSRRLVTECERAWRIAPYEFSTDDIFIRKNGEDVILSPRPSDWSSYLKSGRLASEDFMADIEDLASQKSTA